MEHAISHLLIVSNAEVNGGLKTVVYQIVETVLADIAEKDELNKVLKQYIARLTQLTSIMDAFTSRALESLQRTRPIEYFIKTCMDKPADDWRLQAKDRRMPAAYVRNPLAPITTFIHIQRQRHSEKTSPKPQKGVIAKVRDL